jgi:hypothetical protein
MSVNSAKEADKVFGAEIEGGFDHFPSNEDIAPVLGKSVMSSEIDAYRKGYLSGFKRGIGSEMSLNQLRRLIPSDRQAEAELIVRSAVASAIAGDRDGKGYLRQMLQLME